MNNDSNLNPTKPPVRRWVDGTPPIAETLDEIRSRITRIDRELVDLLYERRALVIGAALFKLDPLEVQAPRQQRHNIGNAVLHALELHPTDTKFPLLIGAIWEVAVPGFVALQAEAFEKTELL